MVVCRGVIDGAQEGIFERHLLRGVDLRPQSPKVKGGVDAVNAMITILGCVR